VNILIVEDEVKIRDVLKAYFDKEGWMVSMTGDGYEALNKFKQFKFDLVILDRMIHGMPGEEVCKKIRNSSNVPIIMITSKSLESDTIEGLNLGADDYITKPFRVKEVVARIHALQRRINDHLAKPDKAKVFHFNKKRLVINFAAKEVYVEGELVNLTTTEMNVLKVMVDNPNRIFSRNELSYEVQGYRHLGDGRSIDAHIKNIRKKIEEDPKNPVYIVTKIGSGYKFSFEPDEV